MITEMLKSRRDEIVTAWIEALVATYPKDSTGFFLNKRDRFQNPVGHTFRTELPLLVDQIAGDMDTFAITDSLDNLMKVRAVQEFSPSQAVAFIHELKFIIHDRLWNDTVAKLDEFLEIYRRVDMVALRAFDVYVANREKVYEIRIRELKAQNAPFMRDPNRNAGESGGQV